MSSRITNRSDEITAEQKLVIGLKKHEQTLASLVIDGTPYKAADIITIVQSLANAAQTVVSSRATWQANILADEAARAKNKTFLSGLRQALLVAFGRSVDVLADFGMAPRKTRTPLTPEQKAKATAKALATRAARHTMGSKQKAAIKGTSVASPPSGDVTKVPATAPASTPAKS